jgi:hypothetical protein
MPDKCDDTNFLAMKVVKNLGGTEAVKDLVAGCHAAEEGRYGYGELMAAKAVFHDIPAHQFSPGDIPKPANTPAGGNALKSADKITK